MTSFSTSSGALGAHISKKIKFSSSGKLGAEGVDNFRKWVQGRRRENFSIICTLCTFWSFLVVFWSKCRWCTGSVTFLYTCARVKLYGEVHQVHPPKLNCFSGGDF